MKKRWKPSRIKHNSKAPDILKVTLVPPILSYLKQSIINPFHQSVRIYPFILSILSYLENLIAVHNTCL